MTVIPLLLLTVLLGAFRSFHALDSAIIIVNVLAWLIFGAVNGIVLYWIKPDHRIGGYLGAAVLGAGGAVLGGGIALFLYENFRQMNLVLFIMLVITASSLFLLISSLFAPQKSSR